MKYLKQLFIRKSLIIVLSLLLITGCRTNTLKENSQVHDTIAVICSHMLIPGSELIFYNKEGSELGRLKFKEKGISKINQVNKNQILLPAERSAEVIKVDLNNFKVETEKTLHNPTFYEKVDDKEIILYNSDEQKDIDYWTYQFRDNDTDKFIRSRGGITGTAVHQQKLYALAVDNMQNHLKVIKLNNFKIEKNIPINLKFLRDIKIIKNNIYIIDGHSEIIKIPVNALNNHKKTTLPYSNSKVIGQFKDKIVISHDDYKQLKVSILDKDTLELLDTFEQDIKNYEGVISSDIDKNKLYALIRTKNDRKVVIINLDTKKVENSITIECKKGILAYNIKIIH